MSKLSEEKRSFIEFAVGAGVLRFGRFTLKSGRVSPYFFDLGAIANGSEMRRLGEFYARLLARYDTKADVLFGPAYKGIPLAVATAISWSLETGEDLAFAYNRKEDKDHGEGGNTVGAPLTGRVVIVDDVVTAGTAVRQALRLIRAAGAEAAGLLVAIDRQERGQGSESAVSELVRTEGIFVASLVTLEDIVAWLGASGRKAAELEALRAYRARYGRS